MLWLMWVACAHKTLDFGTDEPTDLSGEVDPNAIHPTCLEGNTLIMDTPNQGDFIDFREEGFLKYTSIVAPNGGVIPLFAQNQVSDAQLLRARNLLRFFLTNAPNSQWGEDKASVANAMANNGAALVMPNGAHQEWNEPPLDAQPLYDSETPVEGDSWFMASNFDHRDAAFEEIFHLVHDTGIGTFLPGALPDYQIELDSEARAAIVDGRWGIPVEPEVEDWLEELDREDSLAQEYIASVIDSYYGLWAAWDEGAGGMWGIYIAKTRSEVEAQDPSGQSLLRAFLPEYIHTSFTIHPDFIGVFDMAFDPELEYSHRSQYFQHLSLSGENPSDLFGNSLDNTLKGNAADNTLDGRGGVDTVIYCENRSTYTVTAIEDGVLISGPQGTDTIRNIEWVHFADGRYTTEATLSE
ncbi:MAG: hypothetical protein VXZ96_14055 [Myxococcota bacterium]|nr:hypothetical protein [Myxococcota bacterium]